MPDFHPGDRVAYARQFLRSIGAFTGDLPFARGIVTQVHGAYVRVDWLGPDGRVTSQATSLRGNLVHESRIPFEPS